MVAFVVNATGTISKPATSMQRLELVLITDSNMSEKEFNVYPMLLLDLWRLALLSECKCFLKGM